MKILVAGGLRDDFQAEGFEDSRCSADSASDSQAVIFSPAA